MHPYKMALSKPKLNILISFFSKPVLVAPYFKTEEIVLDIIIVGLKKMVLFVLKNINYFIFYINF